MHFIRSCFWLLKSLETQHTNWPNTVIEKKADHAVVPYQFFEHHNSRYQRFERSFVAQPAPTLCYLEERTIIMKELVCLHTEKHCTQETFWPTVNQLWIILIVYGTTSLSLICFAKFVLLAQGLCTSNRRIPIVRLPLLGILYLRWLQS